LKGVVAAAAVAVVLEFYFTGAIASAFLVETIFSVPWPTYLVKNERYLPLEDRFYD